MNRHRLEVLQAHLRQVKPDKFDIRSWGCGSTACAIGHAGRIKEFQDLGFSCNETKCPSYSGPSYSVKASADPNLHIMMLGWTAVEEFFELEPIEARYLFLSQSYSNCGLTTAIEVADRIESLLRDGF